MARGTNFFYMFRFLFKKVAIILPLNIDCFVISLLHTFVPNKMFHFSEILGKKKYRLGLIDIYRRF